MTLHSTVLAKFPIDECAEKYTFGLEWAKVDPGENSNPNILDRANLLL